VKIRKIRIIASPILYFSEYISLFLAICRPTSSYILGQSTANKQVGRRDRLSGRTSPAAGDGIEECPAQGDNE
jgi:hypothetical protein